MKKTVGNNITTKLIKIKNMNEKLTEKDYHNITGDWTWMTAKQLTVHINELVKKVNELEGRIKEIEGKK